MRRHTLPARREHNIEGMHVLLQRSPSDGATDEGKGGCPAVAGHAPVCCVQPEEPPLIRPRLSNFSVGSRISANNDPSKLSERFVNYMVLGESGLGKTTFIYNLVSGFKVLQPGQAHLRAATTMEQFQEDPNSLRTVLAPLDNLGNNTRLVITIQDVPGWGEDLNLRRYLRSVICFLLARRAKDFDLLGNLKACSSKDGTSSLPLPHSITAVLYFLPPHRVKHADVVIMSAISQLVTVIPVIAKSDSMTDRELATYRQELNQVLQQPEKYVPNTGLPALNVRAFVIEPSLLKRLGLQQQPLAVNCSRDKVACKDEALLSMVGPHGHDRPVQPVRQYQWGTVYALSQAHQSDLIPLKRLLLGDQLDGLEALTKDSFERYVVFCKEYEAYERELPALVQEFWALSKPLAFDDYETLRGYLKEVQGMKHQLLQHNKLLAAELKKAEADRHLLQERLWR